MEKNNATSSKKKATLEAIRAEIKCNSPDRQCARLLDAARNYLAKRTKAGRAQELQAQ